MQLSNLNKILNIILNHLHQQDIEAKEAILTELKKLPELGNTKRTFLLDQSR